MLKIIDFFLFKECKILYVIINVYGKNRIFVNMWC